MTTTNNRHPSMTPPGCVVVSFCGHSGRQTPIGLRKEVCHDPVGRKHFDFALPHSCGSAQTRARQRMQLAIDEPMARVATALKSSRQAGPKVSPVRRLHSLTGPDVKPETDARTHSLARHAGTIVCESGFGATIFNAADARKFAPLTQIPGAELDSRASRDSHGSEWGLVRVIPSRSNARPAAPNSFAGKGPEARANEGRREFHERRFASAIQASAMKALCLTKKIGIATRMDTRHPHYFSDPSPFERVGGGSFSIRTSIISRNCRRRSASGSCMNARAFARMRRRSRWAARSTTFGFFISTVHGSALFAPSVGVWGYS